MTKVSKGKTQHKTEESPPAAFIPIATHEPMPEPVPVAEEPKPKGRTHSVRIWLTLAQMRQLTHLAIELDPPRSLSQYILDRVTAGLE